MATNLDPLRQECWTRALHAYGTGKLFEKRSADIGRKLRLVTFLGIAGPALVGGMALAYGADMPGLPILIGIVALVLVVQLLASIWSVVAKWQESYAHAQEAMTQNLRLSRQFEQLGRTPPVDVEVRFQVLDAEYQAQSDRDLRQGIRPEELRRGMREALRQFQRPCAGCKQVPTSMEASNCGVCGNFT